MAKDKTRLMSIGIIKCHDFKSSRNRFVPRYHLYDNIEMIWGFLEDTVSECLKRSAPYQEKINSSFRVGNISYFDLEALHSLPRYYIKYLFTYVFFFGALTEVYEVFYDDLKNLNDELHKEHQLRIKLPKMPKKTPYIEKVKKIRNISITHVGKQNKKNPATSTVAANWKYVTIELPKNEPMDINKLCFFSCRIDCKDSDGKMVHTSEDLEIKGIHELHENCTKYLEEFDSVCAEILEKISCELPLKNGDKEFTLIR